MNYTGKELNFVLTDKGGVQAGHENILFSDV